jgi:hypothetical protein
LGYRLADASQKRFEDRMPPADGAAGYPLETGAEKLAGRRWPEAGPSHIPNWVYTDPEIFAREQERIFAGPGWLYVCLDAEIANPGNFKARHQGGGRRSRLFRRG